MLSASVGLKLWFGGTGGLDFWDFSFLCVVNLLEFLSFKHIDSLALMLESNKLDSDWSSNNDADLSVWV